MVFQGRNSRLNACYEACGYHQELKDERATVHWYRKATQHGHAQAAYNLGAMYAIGNGVDENVFEAYVWISTAAARGYEKAHEIRDMIAANLTAEGTLAAQEQSRTLLQSHPDP